MEFYSTTEKNGILSFSSKWMELENIILSEVSQVQEAKNHMFFLICGIQQYYEKQVMLRGGHVREGEGKRR
jgi:hypothetical protein